jgi:hypothetical protein
MIIDASKRLRKFFDSELTDEMIWRQIIDFENLENIHQLHRLNVEAARALVKRERRMELLSLGITGCPAEVAEELVKYQGEKLFLNCVASLTVEAAKALATFKGFKLMLNGVRSLSLPVLGRLASYKGSLHLDGVETIEISEKDTRRAQTVFQNLEFARLTLAGVKKLPMPLLEALARFPGYLELKGIKSLTRKESEILAESSAKGLALKGLGALTFEMVNLFTRYMGFLDVSGAREIEEDFVSLAAGRPEKHSLFSGAVKRQIDIYNKQAAKEKRKKQREKEESERKALEEEAAAKQKDEALLVDFEMFDAMNLEDSAQPVQAWQEKEEIDPYSPEIEDSVVHDIEIKLNQEINQRRKRVEALLNKGFSKLSQKEKELLQELRDQIENLKGEIRGALDVLVEKKELGSVVFTSNDDLAAYLKQSGAEDDEDDALANIEETDLFGGSFGAGSSADDEIMITDSNRAAGMMDMWEDGSGALEELKEL